LAVAVTGSLSLPFMLKVMMVSYFVSDTSS
jgi:hypothetical protein